METKTSTPRLWPIALVGIVLGMASAVFLRKELLHFMPSIPASHPGLFTFFIPGGFVLGLVVSICLALLVERPDYSRKRALFGTVLIGLLLGGLIGFTLFLSVLVGMLLGIAVALVSLLVLLFYLEHRYRAFTGKDS